MNFNIWEYQDELHDLLLAEIPFKDFLWLRYLLKIATPLLFIIKFRFKTFLTKTYVTSLQLTIIPEISNGLIVSTNI